MEEMEFNDRQKVEIYSKAVRAGKRTYFFDVKSTKSDEYYLTITESKKRFNAEDGKFSYEKHKLFLYKEDFEKFSEGLSDVVEFINTGKRTETPVESTTSEFSDVNFDDLKSESESQEDTL
jgi:hypothetical protein